jgi:hypothetical protein
MFFENAFTGTLPFLRLLLALLLGLSPVAVTILIKLLLYGRLIAEEPAAPAQRVHETLAIEGTLEEFAVALAKAIADFRGAPRSNFSSYSVAGWR